MMEDLEITGNRKINMYDDGNKVYDDGNKGRCMICVMIY